MTASGAFLAVRMLVWMVFCTLLLSLANRAVSQKTDDFATHGTVSFDEWATTLFPLDMFLLLIYNLTG